MHRSGVFNLLAVGLFAAVVVAAAVVSATERDERLASRHGHSHSHGHPVEVSIQREIERDLRDELHEIAAVEAGAHAHSHRSVEEEVAEDEAQADSETSVDAEADSEAEAEDDEAMDVSAEAEEASSVPSVPEESLEAPMIAESAEEYPIDSEAETETAPSLLESQSPVAPDAPASHASSADKPAATPAFPPTKNEPPHEGAQAYDCYIKQGKCPNFPQYVGQFKDPLTASYSEEQCVKRAQWFHDYCGNTDYTPTSSIWGKSGKMTTYQVWHPKDRVQIAITHDIPALCGKKAGSTTVYYGSICANGNIQWEWMRTQDPPTGFTPRQCTWRKAASSDHNWMMQWFGDCETAPTMVPQLEKLHPNKYPKLQREWFGVNDKVQYEVTTTTRGLCAKPSGSRVQFQGTICADGVNVQWDRIKVLEPRAGMSEKECKFNRDTAPKHVLSLFMGSCKSQPKEVPEIKSTVASELLPRIRRGWFKPGDEVYTTIKTTIGSLCAAASGSSTTYKGVICANGNVKWESMSTTDPRAPYTAKQCQWTRKQTTSKKWHDMWLGSCNAAPTGVPQLSSPDPGDLPLVKRNKNTCAKNPCHKMATCERIFPSTHTCTCKKGWQGDGVTCSPMNPCESSPCHKQAMCKMTGPGAHECTCHPGFSGSGKNCTAVDNCVKNPCPRHSQCKTTGPGANICLCDKGYRMQNGVCAAINICATSPCSPHAQCTSTGPGTYTCKCNKGFLGDGKFCREKNDCDAFKSPCSIYAVCTKTGPGTHKCECRAGYKGDGLICEEINSCKSNPCDKHGVCQKTGPGTHKCVCLPGYETKKGFLNTCVEVNSCRSNPCDANAICKKTGPGTNTCTCKKNFKGDGITCDAVDACASHPCPLHSLCHKTGPGEYQCQCKTGYRRHGQLCVEKNPCDQNPCDAHAKCHKTGPGQHVCVCAKGYHMVGSRCEEIDTCQSSPCAPNADCTHISALKHKCACKKGFVGDGVTCREVNNCLLKPAVCDLHAECTMTGPGAHVCRCKLGYEGEGAPGACQEKNNCVPTSPCDKNAFCTMTGPGKHSCTCNKGYTKFGDTCLQVDACLSHPCDRNAECEQTGPGTSSCTCKAGYEGNGFSCSEINSCLSSPCDKHAYCQRDGPAKHKCICHRGYEMNHAGQCQEIDPCLQVPYPCDQHATCTHTGPSAYLCACKPGWLMNSKGTVCLEQDPCSSNPCERTAVCVSTRSKLVSPDGEYRLTHTCKCLPGYKKNLEGRCVATDPCSSNPCDMHAICKKDGIEKFICQCKPGYYMDEKTQTCTEIDTCLTSRPCPLYSQCIKTGPALHSCVCNAGYRMEKSLCVEADSCLSGPCGSHAICQKTGPGTHTCSCVPGFVMDGTTCVADDNLMTRRLKKAANEQRAAQSLSVELEQQQKKLEMDKLAEIAALRQKEELRRFGERLDAFLRQRRIKREFAQDNAIDEIQARIEDLEHAAEVLVKNSEQQAILARELLTKKQSEHHVVEQKQIIQHKHDIDLLSLMKRKVNSMLTKAHAEAELIYQDKNHGYNPVKDGPVAPPKPSKNAAAAVDAADLFPEPLSLIEEEQDIMVDEEGQPVLPTSSPIDLNAPLEPAMLSVPQSDADVVEAPALADADQEAPMEFPRFVAADETDAEAEAEGTEEEFGSVTPVEQAEIPSEFPAFRQQLEAESEANADAETASEDEESEEGDADAEEESEAEEEAPRTFKPELTAHARAQRLPIEPELV